MLANLFYWVYFYLGICFSSKGIISDERKIGGAK